MEGGDVTTDTNRRPKDGAETMTNIDETKGAGSTTSTNRTNRSDGPEEAGEAAEADQASAAGTSATDNLPQKRSVYNRYRDTIYGRNADGELPEDVTGADGGAPAFMMQSRRTGAGDQMAERKQKLGEALDAQYETMGEDWETEEAFFGLVEKGADAWQGDYERRAISSDKYRRSRDQLEASLFQNGRPMSDGDIQEVVADHRGRLEERGAFEGWERSEIESWEKGLTSHLKRQRAEEKIRQFDPAPIEDLPTPNRNLDVRTFDNPDQIRRSLEQWETEQLEKLDELTPDEMEGDVFSNDLNPFSNDGDATYAEKRQRIQRAKEAYEKITVGDENGEKYAFPETVEAGTGELKPRDAYIRHLEEHPGDIMGAYEQAEDRLRDANWDETAELVAAAGA